MQHKEEYTALDKKLIELILADPEARKIAEEFIRNLHRASGLEPSCPHETSQQ